MMREEMIGKTVPNPLVRVCGDDPYNGEEQVSPRLYPVCAAFS
jgi:hypothetical protein